MFIIHKKAKEPKIGEIKEDRIPKNKKRVNVPLITPPRKRE